MSLWKRGRQYWTDFTVNGRRYRKRLGTTSLRVATRRLMSQCVLLDCVVPSRQHQKVRRILKAQLKSLSDLRDHHVQQTFIRCKVRRGRVCPGRVEQSKLFMQPN